MKNVFAVVVAVVAVVASASGAQAGSIDYLSNQSSDYIRMFSRNSSTDGADITSFNPAGAAWLEDGLYFTLSSQTVFKNFSIEHQGEKFESTEPTLALPSFHTVYKWNDLAAFASFTVPAGGGTLVYEKGVPFLMPLALVVEPSPSDMTPTNGRFEGSSMYLAPTVGAAYGFFDMFSIAAAGRAIIASKSYKGSATYGTTVASLDATKSAVGFGGIFGLHVRPLEGLDVAARYELATPLEFESEATLTNLSTDDNAVSSFADGAKEQRDLPAVLGAGIGYKVLDLLRVSVSFNYYFVEAADAEDDTTGLTGYVKSYDDDYENGFDLAAAIEYYVMEGLELSVGYNRSVMGGNKDTYSDFEYSLDAHAFGAGGRYTIMDGLAVSLGCSLSLYDEAKNDQLHLAFRSLGPETFNKQAIDVALAIAWKAL